MKEQEDDEFHVNEDEVEEDYVDSDFDIDENDNNEEGDQETDDLLEKKTTKRKAYDPPKVFFSQFS